MKLKKSKKWAYGSLGFAIVIIATIAYAAAGDRYIYNQNQDKDINIVVNDGGVDTTVMSAKGSSSDITFDNDTLYVDSSDNNVAIGTSTPNKTGFNILDTVMTIGDGASGRQGVLEILGNQVADGDVGKIVFYNEGGTDRLGQIVSVRQGSNDSGDIDFYTSDSGTLANRMTIKADGDIGIGIDSPAVNLHLNEDSSGPFYSLFTNDTTGETASDGFLIGIDSLEQPNIWNYENTDMFFATNNAQRMVIANDGNVGIGETNPTANLHINGGGVSGLKMLIRNDFDGLNDNRMQNLSAGGSAGVQLQWSSNSHSVRARFNSNANTADGGVDTFNIINNSGGVYLAKNSTGWSAISDMRYKTKTKDFENALEKIKYLSTFYYTLNEDYTQSVHLGLSAQEVVKVIPEVVSGDPQSKMGIQYDRLTPVLIKAIQEQQEQIEELKRIISRIK